MFCHIGRNLIQSFRRVFQRVTFKTCASQKLNQKSFCKTCRRVDFKRTEPHMFQYMRSVGVILAFLIVKRERGAEKIYIFTLCCRSNGIKHIHVIDDAIMSAFIICNSAVYNLASDVFRRPRRGEAHDGGYQLFLSVIPAQQRLVRTITVW